MRGAASAPFFYIWRGLCLLAGERSSSAVQEGRLEWIFSGIPGT
ncbi:hypothetical protein CHK_2886 [Christensenella hongkongensis]|uniref:Uncharacterized protein n=1 Tax=Christensenella hongkongensis TaxID=270498 RepID=A0A0M2NB08_9FIRM|nr:hypothetical protein CHK_2886 [Christensenella hongkongensis]